MASDEGDNQTALMGLLLSEIAAQVGEREGPAAMTIEVGDAQLIISAKGWPLLQEDSSEPPASAALKDSVAVLADWAREELDPMIDAFMNMTLEHRTRLVDNLLHDLDSDEDHRANVCDLLRFVDDGLSLDGEAATLSIRIQSAILGD